MAPVEEDVVNAESIHNRTGLEMNLVITTDNFVIYLMW